MPLNLRDNPEPGKCAAKRCRQRVLDGALCPRHLAMSREMVAEIVGPRGEEKVVEIVLSPQQEAQAEATDAEQALAFVQTLEIQDQEGLEFAAALLAEIKGKNNRLETLKKQATAPLNESLKAIRGWFAPAQGALATMEVLLKEKIGEYHRGIGARRDAAVAQITDAATTPDVERALIALGQAVEPAKIDGLQVREIEDFEIVDPFALPRDCLMPDLEYIGAKVKAGIQIPGVRVFKRSIVASRAQ